MNIDKRSKASYISTFVLSELKQKLSPELYYHDVRHTVDVIDTCQKYAQFYDLSAADKDLLRIAASLHDYGYIISAENHEMASADVASMLMAAYGYKDKDIRMVKGMIMATKLNSEPRSLLEAIIADADLDYLGRPDYDLISQKLHDELVANGQQFYDGEWLDLQIRFLREHQYYTGYAKEYRQPGKLKKLAKLEAIKEEVDEEANALTLSMV